MTKLCLRAAALVSAAVLTLTGCGGGGGAADTDPETPYVDAITRTWSQAPGVDAAQARCWGNKFVDTVGLERLRNIGSANQFAETVVGLDYTPLGLTRSEGEEVYAHFTTCGMDLLDSVVDSISAEEDLSGDVRACIGEQVDDAAVRDFIVGSMVGGEQATEEALEGPDGFGAALLTCAYGIDMEQLLEEETTG